MWQTDLAFEVRTYLKKHPMAVVVMLGCGMDQTSANCDNGSSLIYSLDLPNVIKVYNQVFQVGSGYGALLVI